MSERSGGQSARQSSAVAWCPTLADSKPTVTASARTALSCRPAGRLTTPGPRAPG